MESDIDGVGTGSLFFLRAMSFLVAVALFAVAIIGCDHEDSCAAALAHVESCGWELLYHKPCGPLHNRCRTECYGKLTCEELELDEAEFPRKRALCFEECYALVTCRDGSDRIHAYWVCDLEEDCLDGSDEDDCEYFECSDSGDLRPLQYVCDGYDDCEDGSDEKNCDEDLGGSFGGLTF